MKTLRLILLFSATVLFLCCSDNVEQTQTEAANVAPTNQTQSNATNSFENPVEPPTVTDDERKRLDEVTEQFRAVPTEFKNVDFKKRTYAYFLSRTKKSFRLKDGNYEYDLPDYNRGWFDLDDVLFADVTGDEKKEAVVMLNHVSCGGSCDGGATLIYVFSMGRKTPLWKFETGTDKYGCGQRAIQIIKRKFVLDLFGDCAGRKSSVDLNRKSQGLNSFRFKDTTQLVYGYNRKFRLEKRTVTRVPERNVMNYPTLISVQE